MKTLKFLAVGFLLLTLAAGCNIQVGRPTGTPVPSIAAAVRTPTPIPAEQVAGAWEVIIESQVLPQTSTAGFVNDAFGLSITVGHDTDIYYTNNGGATWTVGDETQSEPFGLDIVSENLAWSGGGGGHVSRSTDGGQTWQAVSGVSYTGDVPFIRFLDDQVGWVASSVPNHLYATDDGGQSWTEITLPEDMGKLAAIELRTPTDGYVFDDAGILYVTQDGGQNWSSLSLGLEKELLTTTNLPLTAMRFADADNGLVVLTLTGERGKFLSMHTTDGGQSWDQQNAWNVYGSVYLSHDGTLLTHTNTTGQVTVLRYQAP